ncbi:hypothetical protein [Polyangium spumosum]|uniref:Uncharacterized protein n=1 Tax=Polyangium spumosum TaxID=889282 RepID=A0A6N7PU46_9BACT|nr:hypothetical protein [Polyangium spumosum]MRG93950.1 hypothetical protein [Polyangium spumosum]
MAKLKLPAFNEGTLLQRTLLYVGTFVVGSIGFVALASLIVVSVAKSVLPARGEGGEDGADKPSEVAASPGKPTSKIPRPKRRSASSAPAEPPAEATP